MSESSTAPVIKKPLLSDTLYNYLKKLVTIGLPALGTLYFVLSGVWNLPNPEGVVGSLAAVTAFLGSFLHLSTASYTATQTPVVGDLVVEDHPTEDGKKILVAHLDSDPQTVAGMDKATFNIKPQ
jgi:Putative phage holin Dp-1